VANWLAAFSSLPISAGFIQDVGLAPLILTALVVAALVLIALAMWRTNRFFRTLLWLPMRLFYRLRVIGQANVPSSGPALLVSNHVSFIDAFLVYWAQSRPIRFIIWAPFTRVPFVRWVLRLARVIPIDASSGPRAILHSLRLASEALADGELVCLFAEGGITRTGFMLPFQRGMEQILKRTPAPVIPVCLDHVWGSIFSYRGGRFLWKLPRKLPYPVTVSFGTPLPASTTALEVRQTIQKLSADSSIARSDVRPLVHRQFLRMASRHPFRSCMIDTNNHDKNLSYGQVLAATIILGKRLEPLLGTSTMVGVWLPPSVGGAIANMALTFNRRIPVDLNYTSSNEVVHSAVRQCSIRYILTSRLFLHKVPLDIPATQFIFLEDFRKSITQAERLRAFLAILFLPAFVLERRLGLHQHHPDDLATVIFSSGSTGDPKGVMLTHRNLAANAESVVQAIDPGPRDRLVGVLPFFHSFGFTITIWVPLQVGASLVYHPDPRQAKEIGEICRRHRCTILLLTPTFLRICLKRCGVDDFTSLRILMCGAEKLAPDLAQEFREHFHVQPLEGYGCTELSPVAAANVPDWQEGSVRQVGNKPGTIGQPIPGVAARIVNPDTLQPVAAAQEGLILFYGANVMKGYLGRPEATQAVIRDGWYITGDIGRFDEDGFITLTDRLSRFSKIGGEMVPHQKIEDELHHILGTTDRVCVVSAVPDDRRGERLVVMHTPLNGLDEAQLCRELSTKGLPNLWVPSARDFFQVSELPLLGSGKVDLKRVREMALEHTRGKAS
jgi:acyl-[acyl-carrier-protein]-phospholipid O-acyltransferase/long-chain-fatty-acid--[acyl-carrier-protein] ligase